EVITSQGKLEAKEYVDVGSPVSGQLKKLHVELGDVVKEGDLIAEIDPKIYESQVEATQARLKTLAAQKREQAALVEQAKQKFDRNQTLFKADAISKEVFQDAQTALNVANAQIASIDAQIEEANSSLQETQTNLGFTKIFAPMAGTVVSQTSREGQTLNANQAAPVIVQVADLDILTVRAQVAEADIMNIKVGMPAYFTILGSQDRKWNGTVRQILPTPDVVNDVVLYNVLIDVDNKDRQLMLNMSTQMFFEVGKAENVPVIPVGALGKRLEDKDSETGQAYTVKVSSSGKIEDREIYIGLMDRTNAEVKSGLKPGEKVAEASVTAKSSDTKQPARMPRF
ncbi:MAG: efflux RND transporter periplasmic adaptor subunit, partial [Micavibrio aeruginosavorus]